MNIVAVKSLTPVELLTDVDQIFVFSQDELANHGSCFVILYNRNLALFNSQTIG